jgi:hypothetical protein
MSETTKQLEALIARGYQHGFVTDIDSDTVPPGLDEDVVRLISRKKQEPAFLTEWRLKALRHWLTMKEPHWAHLKVAPIDYRAISYYSAPKTVRHPKPEQFELGSWEFVSRAGAYSDTSAKCTSVKARPRL